MATAGDETRIGGWWKMYPFANDPKFIRLDDLAFRLLIIAFEFASAAPWDLQRRGWLYHNESFPVDAMDFQRCVPQHSLEEVETALDALCAVGGAKHTLLVWDGKRRAWRVRAWRKWQDGFARYFSKAPPKNRQETAAKSPHKTIDVRRKTEDNVSCRSRAKPRKLTDEQNAVKQGAIDYFYERLQGHTGLDKPRFPGGRAAKFFTECIRDGYDADDLREVTDWFFAERIRGDHSSANFGHYQSSFNAGCIAAQKRREAKNANP